MEDVVGVKQQVTNFPFDRFLSESAKPSSHASYTDILSQTKGPHGMDIKPRGLQGQGFDPSNG